MLMSRRGDVSGRIRLGCALPSGGYIFHPWVNEFRQKYPDVTLQIEQTEPGPLLGSLRSQELDGGLVLGRIRGRGLVHHKMMEDPITLIVPLNHPWSWPGQLGKVGTDRAAGDGQHERAGGEVHSANGTGEVYPTRHEDENWVPAIKLGMLKDQPVVLEHGIGESHSDARRALNDALEERGFSTRDLRVVMELPGPMAVACAVAEGLGVGLVPQSVARRLIGQVIPVRIEAFSLAQHVYLIHDRKALHTPAVGAWWKYITSKVGQQRPVPEAEEEVEEPRAAPEKVAAATRRLVGSKV
jgi:DNA-binding transcriptional LysR family regulator